MRNIAFITVLLLVSLNSYGKEIQGTIITNGTSRNVTFDIKVTFFMDEPNFERIQYKVRYYDEMGKKRTLRPADADEIRFEYDGMDVRMISCPNTLGGNSGNIGDVFSASSKIFLKLEIDGPLRLYRFYFKQTTPGSYGGTGYSGGTGFSPGTTYTQDNLIFQKGSGPLKKPKSLGWKKDMLAYFSDCPALREKIESKDMKRKEIEEIVMYYNQHCGAK